MMKKSSSSAPNVRLVRCPKCREVLPEPADVPFYRCGGCDTILQAKHYNKENEKRKNVPEGSSSAQLSENENCAHGGEPSTCNSPLSVDSNEGINQDHSENGIIEQLRVLNFSSTEASPSRQQNQQPLSSSDHHVQDRDEETDQNQNLQVTKSFRKDSSLNEEPLNSVPVVDGEVEGESVEQHGDIRGSSSNEPMEEPAQDEIVVEEQLEAADFSCESTSSESTSASSDGEVGVVASESSLHEPTNEEVMAMEQHFVANTTERQPVSQLECEHEVSSTNVSVLVLQGNGSSQFITESEEVSGANVVDECVTDGDVYSNTVTSPNKPTSLESKRVAGLVTENQEVDANNGEQVVISAAVVNSMVTDESTIVLPEVDKTSVLQSEVLTPPDENRDIHSQHSVIGDQALPITIRDEVVNLDDTSLMAVDTSPRGRIDKAARDDFESVAAAHLEAGTSYRDLPKSATRSSLAYDGSVSSYDGNEDKVAYQPVQRPSGTMQGTSKTESPAAYQRKTNNLRAISAGEEYAPVMLNEIRIPQVPSDVPNRRIRMRPRTQEFPSRAPLYTRSQEIGYESSDPFVHNELYDRYRYRDAESRRHLNRSNVDGRMISEAVYMGREFHMHPYPESSGEIYPYPRHPMYYRGYRALDSYSHLYPTDMRWSSHFPPPGVSYTRSWYGPRERELFDSDTSSPQVFSDSDYYARSHDSVSEDQRTRRLRVRRNSQAVQHLQPIGGGSPFITCYKCSELLQLPSDFLPYKGIKINRVKCSSCSRILKFTLENGCHLIPYVPKTGDKLVKSASASQTNNEYESFHRRSASASIYNAENVSVRRSSQAPAKLDKGKNVMVDIQKPENAATGSCSPDIPRNAKVTWKLPDRSNSPLHRLMGYPSPSAVLYGYGSDEIEKQE